MEGKPTQVCRVSFTPWGRENTVRHLEYGDMVSSSLHKKSRAMCEVAPIAEAVITYEVIGYESDTDTEYFNHLLFADKCKHNKNNCSYI